VGGFFSAKVLRPILKNFSSFSRERHMSIQNPTERWHLLCVDLASYAESERKGESASRSGKVQKAVQLRSISQSNQTPHHSLVSMKKERSKRWPLKMQKMALTQVQYWRGLNLHQTFDPVLKTAG
jgi:hypothetical protein